MRRHAINIVLCIVVVLGGLLGSAFLADQRAESVQQESLNAITTDAPPAVHVQVIQPEVLVDELVLSGALIPWNDKMIASEIPGKIVWYGAEDGQIASPGQELVKLDSSATEARIAELDARIKLAGQELSRVKSLSTRGVSAVSDLDRVSAEFAVLQAQKKSLEISIEKSVIRAPTRGTVDSNFKSVGEYVDPGVPILRYVRLDRLKFIIGVPERDVPYFEAGDKVAFYLDAFPGEELEGWIYNIQPVADMTTRTFTTTIAVNNADRKLRPGMIGRSHLVRETHESAIVVPLFAIVTLDDKRYVFIEENGVAQGREVTPGLIKGDQVQILSGLEAGDRVIVVGQRDARPGQPVDVVKTIQ